MEKVNTCGCDGLSATIMEINLTRSSVEEIEYDFRQKYNRHDSLMPRIEPEFNNVGNRVAMLDMDAKRNIIGCTEQVRGSGDTNYNSLFKSLLNYSRRKTKNSKGVQEIMSEYPPRFKFTFDVKLGDKSEGANRTAAVITADNVEIKDVTHLNYLEALPKFSTFYALTSTLNLSTFASCVETPTTTTSPDDTSEECCNETPTTTIYDDTSDEYCDMPDLE